MNDDPIFGFPEEWRQAKETNAVFFQKFPSVLETLEIAFSDKETTEPIEKFVAHYGRLCCEDFFEILLCFGNGYGAGAMKLLRSLYEHAVTLRYLHDNPEKLDDFWKFHAIARYKELVAIRGAFGDKAISDDHSRSIEEEYEAVKKDFKIVACKGCGTERINHTWSPLDFVSMTKATGNLGKLIFSGYYVPLRHAHSSKMGLFQRLKANESGGISFVHEAQPQLADDALRTAYQILVEVFKVQQERFQIQGLKERIELCEENFLEIYAKKKSRTKVNVVQDF